MKKYMLITVAAVLAVTGVLLFFLLMDGRQNGEVPPATDPMPTELQLSCSFKEMPEKNTDLAEVYLSDNIAIFTFITAGMDAATTELVTYDLASDKLLGSLDLGEGIVSIFPTQNGEFAVFSLTEKVFSLYNASCQQLSAKVLGELQEEIGFVGYNGKKLLLYPIWSAKPVLYDPSTDTVTEVALPAEPYQFIGTYGSKFLIEAYDKGLISIGEDASVETVQKGASAQVVGSTYAAGIRGDYVTLFSLLGGDPVMAPQMGNGELFCDAEGAYLLSHSQSDDLKDSLYLYFTDTMSVAQVQTGSKIVDAAIYGKYALCITRDDFGGTLKYGYVDFRQSVFEAISANAYDNSIINGVQPLPEPQGSTQMVALINRIYEEYGVRIAYEEGVLDLEHLEYIGFQVTLTTEEEAMKKAILLEKLLSFLPEGLLKEMNSKRPVVIYLCQNLIPSAGGINTVLDGYNVSILSVTGNDDFFLNIAAHEMAHAIEQGMSGEVLSGWRLLMPREAQNAYGNLWLTVEYTPDDKGKTPVWFIDVYGRSSEIEDRAVIFAAMFDAYVSGDFSIFEYEGISKKADYWCQMLKLSYDCCKNSTLNWKRG